MNILAIGNKIISETLNLPDELRPTEREIAAMVSFLHKLSSKASPELAALREAGKKMAEMLKPFAYAFNKVDGAPLHKKGEGMTVPYSVVDLSLKTKMIDWKNISAALAEWESANK